MKIDIYGHTFTISLDDSNRLQDGVFGCTHSDKAEIVIRRGLAMEIADVTITHELVHALLMVQGRWGQKKFTDEEICEFVAWNGTEIQSLRNKILSGLFDSPEDPA